MKYLDKVSVWTILMAGVLFAAEAFVVRTMAGDTLFALFLWIVSALLTTIALQLAQLNAAFQYNINLFEVGIELAKNMEDKPRKRRQRK